MPSLRQFVGAALIAAVAATGCGPGSVDDDGGPGGYAGWGAGGDAGSSGGSIAGPHVVLPEVIALPYVLAGAGGSVATVTIKNDGDEPALDLAWSLTGSDRLTVASAPDSLPAGGAASLTVAFDGAPAETIEHATLGLDAPAATGTTPVFAVAGAPELGTGTWEAVVGPGGVVCGEGITLSMPTAPFPHAGASFTDASVRLFVPDGYRDRGAQDVVLHFHGHSTTLADTLAAHRYEAHVCASGVNAILVVPQGPYLTASGDFGKLMDPGGLEALVAEAFVALYREARIASPLLGDLVLTSHSGGYAAVARNVDPAVNDLPVRQIELFDSIYGYGATFVAYAEDGGILRSNYTAGGGTLANNQNVVATLEADGHPVATAPTMPALLDPAPLVYFADTTHSGSTRLEGAYGEQLRFGSRHHRRGARIELRQAIALGGAADVRWFAPFDEDTTGFRVQRSADGGTWATVAETDAFARQASLAWSGGARVRVVPVVDGVVDPQPSDTYRMDEAASVLVVDGFSRVLDGSWGGLAHDFAAVVGEAAGGVASASSRAVTEDGLYLGAFAAVVWLTGDESTADRSLDAAERAALDDYVANGGSLVVSGSEIGWDLGGTATGDAFLADVFGASVAADDAGSYVVAGTGALGALPAFGYAGPTAPYPEDFPDAFAAIGPGEEVLRYGTALGAAVGVPGHAVIVGFPLELVDDDDDRAALLAALLAFVGS